MNKYSIFLLSAIAVGLASCEDTSDLGKAQVNPQLPMFDANSVEFIAYPYIDASDPSVGEVKIGYYSVDLPEGYALRGTIQLSPYEDFSKIIESPLISDQHCLYANVAELAAQYTATISESPETTDLHARTILTAFKGTDEVRIGEGDMYYGVTDYAFTPVAAEKIISPVYYLVPGNGTDWAFEKAIMMSHSDINQYDNPYFSALATKPYEVGDRWVIMSQESYGAAYESSSIEGVEYLAPVYDRTEDGIVYGEFMKQTGAPDASMLPTLNVPCEITFDAKSMTYVSKPAILNYYATGNGWADWGAHWMPLSTTDFSNYYGFLNLDTKFKFAPQAGWGGDFGAANAPKETESNGAFTYEGKCKDSSVDIEIGHPGMYFATLNVVDWTYKLQQTKTWGLIGAFNGWGGDIAMTPSADLYTWKAELTVTDGQGWKFRANSDWAINLGGKADELWANGADIVLPAGTYEITLNLSTYPATYTAVKK